MKKTFIAVEPGRYVLIERYFTIKPGQTHKCINSVTGYKMVVDMNTMCYDSFITENGCREWCLYNKGKQITQPSSFWLEVKNGYLVEISSE